MDKVLELRAKRAKAWEAAKAFLDAKRGTDGIISAEDNATYDKMEADVVALGKEIDRLERQNALDRELNAPTSTPLSGKPGATGADNKTGRASEEYKKSFWNYARARSGEGFDAAVRNALQVGTDSEGGYLAPDEFEHVLLKGLAEENIFRRLAKSISTASGDRKIPVVTTNGTATWVDEEGPIDDSDDAFDQVVLGAHKLGTLIKVSEELLYDNVFNLEAYIAEEFARRIGAAEETAFFTGDGDGKPTGILAATGGAETGLTAASASAITADEILDLYHSLKTPYRRNGVFVTNDATVKVIRKLKDGEGRYLWQPALQGGAADTILGKQLITASSMPTIEASAKTVAFGDFSHYWIADRQGRTFKRLNELYAANGQVGFIATQRVDGKLTLVEAIQVLKQHA